METVYIETSVVSYLTALPARDLLAAAWEKTMTDEIIREVWKAKDAISARHQHSVKRLVEHLRAEERTSGTRVVDLRARRHAESRTAT